MLAGNLLKQLVLFKMQKGLIITLPRYDDTTEYLTFYSRAIIQKAENRELKIKKVENGSLNIKEFSNILKKMDYKLVVLNGHGTEDSVFGYKNNEIIKVGKNEKLLNSRIVYSRSCNSAVILGKKIVEEGDGCFIGYILPFVFYIDERWSTKPAHDKIAKLFLEPSNQIPLSIIKGHSGEEADTNSRKHILKTINKLLASKEKETALFLEALWNNYTGQVLLGNKDVRLQV